MQCMAMETASEKYVSRYTVRERDKKVCLDFSGTNNIKIITLVFFLKIFKKVK